MRKLWLLRQWISRLLYMRALQPWLDAPHSEVLEDLYAEKLRVKEAGCAEVVVNANDLLILAVEDCVSKCAAMRQQLAGASCLAEVADG